MERSGKTKTMIRIYIYLLCTLPGIFVIIFVASLLDSSILEILLSIKDFDVNDVGSYVITALLYYPFIFVFLIIIELFKVFRK